MSDSSGTPRQPVGDIAREVASMSPGELAAFALQRMAVSDGMPIDAETWTTAHAFHEGAQRLHARGLHGWGIVTGLRVTVTNAPSRALIVQPGLALDRNGNLICVPQPERLALPTGGGTACCMLRFAEKPAASANGLSTGRVEQSYSIRAAGLPPHPNDVELARVALSSGDGPVRQPADEWAPRTDEVDERFRRQLQVLGGETLSIGELALTNVRDQGAHRQGLLNLMQELRATVPFAVRFSGAVTPREAAGQCNLLYLCGAGLVALTQEEGSNLQSFLRSGGVLFAEPCAEKENERQESGRFLSSLKSQLADLRLEIAELGAAHPVLRARHVFGTAPSGIAGSSSLAGNGNLILGANDYGCCWLGGAPGSPQPREVIRSATEFGANLAWYAMRQVHRAASAAREERAAAGSLA